MAGSSGLALTFGTFEEAKAMIGFAAEPRVAELAVEAGMTRYYASSLEDGNPSYWDEDFAAECLGGLIAPPG